MIMENDEFNIPKEYLQMSVAQLEERAKKVMEEIDSKPREIRERRKVAEGKREITFYL